MMILLFPYDWAFAIAIAAVLAVTLFHAFRLERKKKARQDAVLATARRMVGEIVTESVSCAPLPKQTLAKIAYLRRYVRMNGLSLKAAGTTDRQLDGCIDRLTKDPGKQFRFQPIRESVLDFDGKLTARGFTEPLRPPGEREITVDELATAANDVLKPVSHSGIRPAHLEAPPTVRPPSRSEKDFCLTMSRSAEAEARKEAGKAVATLGADGIDSFIEKGFEHITRTG